MFSCEFCEISKKTFLRRRSLWLLLHIRVGEICGCQNIKKICYVNFFLWQFFVRTSNNLEPSRYLVNKVNSKLTIEAL